MAIIVQRHCKEEPEEEEEEQLNSKFFSLYYLKPLND